MKTWSSLLRIVCGAGLLAGLVASGPVLAGGASSSPVGRWRTIDDSTHRPKSIVRLWEKDRVIYGTIEQVIPAPGKPDHPVCDKCEGGNRNKPIEGMTFMWGMRQDDDEWSGGRILDPENGKIYRCTIEVVSGGTALKVRGYVGFSVFGRTQYWQRMADEPPTI